MMEVLKLVIAIFIGFGIGVWFEYLNMCFWKYYYKKKNSLGEK
jgi:hypothetical protein